MKSKTKIHKTFRLAEETLHHIETLARLQGRSEAEIVTIALDRMYIQEEMKMKVDDWYTIITNALPGALHNHPALNDRDYEAWSNGKTTSNVQALWEACRRLGLVAVLRENKWIEFQRSFQSEIESFEES